MFAPQPAWLLHSAPVKMVKKKTAVDNKNGGCLCTACVCVTQIVCAWTGLLACDDQNSSQQGNLSINGSDHDDSTKR